MYPFGQWKHYADRVKRIWYLSPMRAAKVQASLRIRAVSPEPSLLAHTSSEWRGTFRQKARSLAPLNGWAGAIEICHDGMLEDTNSLDGAHAMIFGIFNKFSVCIPLQVSEERKTCSSEANICFWIHVAETFVLLSEVEVDVFYEVPLHSSPEKYLYQTANCPIQARIDGGTKGWEVISCNLKEVFDRFLGMSVFVALQNCHSFIKAFS